MDLRNLILRIVFSAALAIVGFLICRMRLPAKLSEITSLRFDLFFLALFTASRFLVFFIAFCLLHQQPHADLPAYYMPEAHWVMHGLIPYRDFRSSYAPLNPYLDGLLLHMHDSPLSILVFQIICDIVSIPFWIGFLRRFLSETTLRRSALLYLVQPIVFWGTCIDGKNHACISLLLAIALFAIAKKEIVSGISYSLSFVLVKVLPLMFLPAMFSGARRRAKWLLSAAFFPVIVYGWFAIRKIDVTLPLRAEGQLVTPANLPFLATLLSGFELPSHLVDTVFILAVTVAVAIAVRAQLRSCSPSQSSWRLSLSMLFVLFALLLFSKKSDPIYTSMCFFLLSAFTAVQMERPFPWVQYPYALVSLLGLPVASFWYWPLGSVSAVELHAMLLTASPFAIVMLIGQILLLASYVLLAARIFRELLDSHVFAEPTASLLG